MGKVITVWGSPGSGKSMFSCILAKALTRAKRKAIIINAEISVPMLPVWLPEQIIQTNASVGQVLSSVEIDTTLVASHVTVLKSYPFIGLMGYSAGENPLSYPEVKYAMVLQLVNAAAKLVDFVILDCSSNMTNVFTPAAIESGDLVIRLLTPDLKGVRYPSPRGVKTEEIIGDTKIIGEFLRYRLIVKVLVSDYDTLPSHPERQLYTGIPRRSHPRQIHVVAFPQYGIKPLFRPSVIYGLNVCQRIDRETLVLILGQLV